MIRRSTWNPAREIQHEELGNLSVGSPADVAVLRLETGKFGFTDMYGARLAGHAEAGLRTDAAQRQGGLRPERNHAARIGTTLPKDYLQTGDPRWDGIMPQRRNMQATPRGAR